MDRRQFLVRGGVVGAGLAAGLDSAWPDTRQAPARTGTPPRSVAPTGDLLVVNANVITLDPVLPFASAVLIQKGRIAAVGDTRQVRSVARKAREYDAGGRVVIPGFVDNHCHVEDSCIVGDEQPSIAGSGSIEAMVAKVRAVADRTPKGNWVLMQAAASDFPDRVAEKRWLIRQDLDAATKDHPVMVVLGIHACILNTRAWKLTGYWEPGNEQAVRWKGDGTPRAGSYIHRDESGHPIGLATEVWDFRPGYTVEQYKASMRRHFTEWFLSKGLTTITTIQDTAPNEFLALQELQQEGGLPVRLRVYPVAPHAIALSDLIRVGWRSGFGDEMFKFGGVKFFVDGIGTDFMGKRIADPKWTREALTEALTACQRGGVQAIMHVVNVAHWDLVMDSLEAATRAVPGDLHHRVDHVTVVDDDRIKRASALGITCGITAPRQVPSVSPAGGSPDSRMHRYRTLVGLDMAIAVLDAAGPGGSYHPMQGIANMITERSAGGSAPPGESVTLDQALRMWTLWPARNNFEDHEKGSIEIGKFGDLCVLSADPRGRSAREVHGITTHATILGGRVVYEVTT